MIQMPLPKILFLADEIPQSRNAGSILFYRLLEGYPSDKLMVVGRKPSPGAEPLACRYLELGFPRADRVRLSRFNRLLADAEALGLMRYELPETIEREIDAFAPDVVITLMQLFMYYSTACKVAAKRKLPLLMFCHDDVEEFSNVHDWARKRLVRKNALMYRQARTRLCISPEMAAAWEQKYGAKGDVLYPLSSADLTARSPELNNELRQPGVLTIAYAGTPAYGYGFQIEEMLPSFREAGAMLRFYGAKLPSNLEGHDCVEFAGFNSPSVTWSKVKEECDAVLLPYTWREGTYQHLYRTHFPSKLAEYLGLGMPVIVVGPHSATGVAWARRNKEAVLVLDQRSPSEWTQELIRLKEDATLRSRLALEAGKAHKKYFDYHQIRTVFQQFLGALK